MTTRHRIGDLLLTITLLLGAVFLGGTVYQMLVINPEWGGALPASLPAFFGGSQWAAAMARFWTHPLLGTFPLFLVGALVALWPHRPARLWLGASLGLFLVVTLWTGSYFIPEIEPLMVKAGAGLTPEQITERAGAWLFWDRIRFLLIIAAYLASLRAYRHSAPARPTAAA
ncbi:MAG TPA: hypothetical protein VGB24_03060 [Longimicrobium sp.]|jgi:ABC-type multidrug transport system permease subunit|uniref:hypothetical protein n=1 Tax=Longimicrobium sp. TaxID=2029185 RepID=UPI002ED88F71